MTIKLPAPDLTGTMTVEQAIRSRRSVRNFSDSVISMAAVSQVLWAAQGISGGGGVRTVPSAGGLYPLEIYCVAGAVDGLPAGVYRYAMFGHELVPVVEGESRESLAAAALGQKCVRGGAASIIIAAVFDRATGKYSRRGIQYATLEAGHAAQNICLQVVALGLGTVAIGAFQDDKVKYAVRMRENETPLYIMPIGAV
ncbi:MAG: SagB/ThcOx family dehydrogenase [Spirochaetes bacterium]|jgi:SagB-type dehydrogenase family enzyme|nr:SagB/ThcOx family dehydrogenase [Spirochaetota bacterium]